MVGVITVVVVVVMIHLSLVVLDLVWVVDSGDCYLLVSLWLVGVSEVW